MKLSILVASIPNRTGLYTELYSRLMAQLLPEVEVITRSDGKDMSIGLKRQLLLQSAVGDYVCYIDDDDTVADYYVYEILKGIETGPDCIGFKIDCMISGQYKNAIASMKYRQWADNKDGYDYVRSIYHKTPVKREIALQAGFKDLRYAEDHDYAMRLQQYLHTETFIDKVMYYYRYTNENHQIKFGIK